MYLQLVILGLFYDALSTEIIKHQMRGWLWMVN